ncbi:hypothetical protein [Gordonia liuliyuniae]|uniref:Lipoprotein n=1 Tax=Gordonia liuliyuniae TaxID=2911517 RepID=A0ABS9IWE4_9ACTN|nr:hypothetical protein [Gordonia liuliyuniae]MCF8589893.1 hypothetical protein [Gordonia liuliyuniae]
MRARRAATPVVYAAACAVALAACGSSDPDEPSRPPQPSEAQRLSLDDCDAATRTGTVDRRVHGLRYAHGVMQVRVEPSRGDDQCIEFLKWGNAAVGVPPDTLLFTFSGGGGEGGQFEFLSSALTGGRIPGSPPAGKLTDPISAKVGVSVDGAYYAASTCSLTLTQVTEQRATGRFDCPEAIEQSANPFSPSDDVPYDDEPAPTSSPRTADLSGRFDVVR